MTRSRLAAVAGLAVLVLLAAPLAHPRLRSALRRAPGFAPLAGEPRIWLEPGAEGTALSLAEKLPDSVARVESVHGTPFPAPFRVCTCATEESFARLPALAPGTPVRGMALWRDVWISPRAFRFAGRDTPASSSGHLS